MLKTSELIRGSNMIFFQFFQRFSGKGKSQVTLVLRSCSNETFVGIVTSAMFMIWIRDVNHVHDVTYASYVTKVRCSKLL